jgi:uncharacterized membrane protein YebE (DUF533 family)
MKDRNAMTARHTKSIIIAAAGLLLASGAAFAGREDTIDANDAVLRQRIEQGRYNGQLTRREYRDLNTEQAKIEADIARAKADGYISKREYKKIHDEQIAAYGHVKADTHNPQVSWWRRFLYLNRN